MEDKAPPPSMRDRRPLVPELLPARMEAVGCIAAVTCSTPREKTCVVIYKHFW